MAKRVDILKLEENMRVILNDLAKNNALVVGKELAMLPGSFRNAALKHYPTVLRVRTGRLRQSFEEVSRRQGESNWVVGLRSRVEYAAVHEFGFSGTVNVEEHTRNITQAFGKQIAPTTVTVRSHQRKMNIREKRFFRDPMELTVKQFIRDLIKRVGFKR